MDVKFTSIVYTSSSLQVTDVDHQVVLLLILDNISPWNEWNVTKTTQPRPQVFSVNGLVWHFGCTFDIIGSVWWTTRGV